MTWTRHPADGGVVNAVFAAVTPYLNLAATSAPEPPAMAVARVYASPLQVEITHYDKAGRARFFRPPVDDLGLADVIARFLSHGFARVPVSTRQSAVARVESGAAGWVVLADVLAGTAAGVLVPTDGTEVEVLFVLESQETLH